MGGEPPQWGGGIRSYDKFFFVRLKRIKEGKKRGREEEGKGRRGEGKRDREGEGAKKEDKEKAVEKVAVSEIHVLFK